MQIIILKHLGLTADLEVAYANFLYKKREAISFIEKNFAWKIISKKLSDLFINDSI